MRPLDSSGDADPLARAVRSVGRGEGLDSALDEILRGAAEGEGAALALVVAANDDGRGRHVLRSRGLAEGDIAILEAPAVDAADPADPLAVAEAEHRLVESSAADPGGSPRERGLVDRLGLARLEALPLVVARGGIDHVVGVLALGWRAAPGAAAPSASQTTPGASSPSATAPSTSPATPGLVVALADLAAIAIDRANVAAGAAERTEWTDRLAHLDPLTGLANRRTFDRILELELARAARQQSEVAVAIFDVDAFRETNDAAGHPAGDDVLRAVAAVIAEQVRLVDTVARIGGDEFVVVAPGNGGPAVAERVIRAIQALPAVDGRAVSVSAGVARFPVDGASPEEIVAGALDALEAARHVGIGAMASAPATG